MDMGGVGFNNIAARTYQFVKGAASGVMNKLTFRPYGANADMTAWVGERIVPDFFSPNDRPQPILGNVLTPYQRLLMLPLTDLETAPVLSTYEECMSVNHSSGPERILAGAARKRSLQSMTGNTFRLRSVYHAALGQNLPTTVFGTMTGGAVKLRCYI
jgi:hypothetical protein